MVKVHTPAWFKAIFKNKLALIVSLVLLTVVIGLASWFVYNNYVTNWIESYKYNSLSVEDKATKDREVYIKAYEQDSYEMGQDVYDKALKVRTESSDRGIIYDYKSQLAINFEKYDEALQFAKEAERLNSTRLTAATLGRIYFVKQEYKLSAENYQTAADRSDNPNDPTIKSPYNEYIIFKSQAEGMIK